MHKPAFEKKDVELLFVWIIPSVILLTSFCYWYLQGKLAYFGFLYAVPLTFAAIFVNIATDYLNVWRWKVTFFPRLRLLYRPVVYAIYYNLTFMLGAHLLTARTTAITVLESALVIGFIGMMVGALFDLFTLDVGFIYCTKPQFDIEKYGTILALTRYAFRFFGAIALAGGVAAKIGHYYLYETQSVQMHWLPLGVLAGAAISPPFIVWAYLCDSRDIPTREVTYLASYSLDPGPVETEETSRPGRHAQIPGVSAGL